MLQKCTVNALSHMKDEIKSWLKQSGRDREWLAQQLFVTKRTVDNWLSSPKVIPGNKLALIGRLMEDDAAAETMRQKLHHPANHLFSLEVDRDTFTLFNRASAQARQTIEEWAIDELTAAATESLSITSGHQAAIPPPVQKAS